MPGRPCGGGRPAKNRFFHLDDGRQALPGVRRGDLDANLIGRPMPVAGGVEATSMTCAEEAAAAGATRIPNVAATVSAVGERRDACIEVEMDDDLSSRVNPEQLGKLPQRPFMPARAQGPRDTSPGAAACVADESLPVVEADEALLDRSVLEQIHSVAPPGDGAFLERMVNMYLARSQDLIESLRSGVADASGEAIRNAAHSLKGSSATMGVVALASLCAELEAMGREESVDDAGQVLAEIDRVYPAVCEQLPSEARRLVV